MSKGLFEILVLSTLLAFFLGNAAFALPPSAPAVLTVDTTVDEADGDCLFDGDCSLRDAVATIDVGGSITVPAGNYRLNLGEISISQSMTIKGAGARATIIDAHSSSRIFVTRGADVILSRFTLTGGASIMSGGAILHEWGALLVADCTITRSVAFAGGAIRGQSGTLQVVNSTLSGNEAGNGGAIFTTGVNFWAINNTISGNRSSYAAVYAVEAYEFLAYNTIANNSGGGLYATASVFLFGNVLDQNTTANCIDFEERPLRSEDNLSSDTSCPFVGSGDISNVSSLLLPLADNGGPTDTHALPANSPAVDSATHSCDNSFNVDQRGVLRPQGAYCDRGAFELEHNIASSVCRTLDFSSDLGPLRFSNVGDANQGAASVVGGKVQLTTDGSTFYHATDNGAFLHQAVSGDFRIEVELAGFPVNAGGGYRRSGITVRSGTGPTDPRVFVEFLPQHPSYLRSALMFDYRGIDGVARELASTKLGLALPTRLAIDRRGDKFTVWYSTDGIKWIKPKGAAGGSVTIAMPATVEVGLMSASYDTSVTLTSEFDNFDICRPSLDPLPALPPAVACKADQPLDVVYLLDASGSAVSAFPGGPTNLDAARQAVKEMNDLIEANLPGSRAAVIAYWGGQAPAYTTGAGAKVLSPLTSNLDAAESAAATINVLAINPSTSSTLSHALAVTRKMLVNGVQPGSRPVVVLLGDGFVNVDINGNGPDSYKTAEMMAISLISGLDYLTVGEAGWAGNWNGSIATWDGEALANAMAQSLLLKQEVPGVSVFTFGLRSARPYRMDLLGFLADYTGGTYSETTDIASLRSAVDTTFSKSLSCTP